MSRTKIYIDGENLMHSVIHVLLREKVIKSREEIKTFLVRQFLSELLPEAKNAQIIYYGTKLRVIEKPAALHKRTKKIINQNRTLVAGLVAENIKYIRAGNLVARTGSKCRKCGHMEPILREKGVDVRMAVDILYDAMKSKAQNLVVLSSDSDLLPALQLAKKFQKITYVGFSEALNVELTASTSRVLTYTAQQIKDCYKRNDKR